MGGPCMDYKAKNRGPGDIDPFLNVMTELFCRFKLFPPSPSTLSLCFFLPVILRNMCSFLLHASIPTYCWSTPWSCNVRSCTMEETSNIISVTFSDCFSYKIFNNTSSLFEYIKYVWYFINNGLLFFLPLRTAQLLHLSPTCNKNCIWMHSENFNCSDEPVQIHSFFILWSVDYPTNSYVKQC